MDSCKASDAVILGAVGGQNGIPYQEVKDLKRVWAFAVHWDYMQIYVLQLFLNRFAMLPSKRRNRGDALDIMVVRELTGGIYFGQAVVIRLMV